VYSNIKKAVSDQGVIFMGSTDALKERPDIFRKWFGKVIPTGDNKFSALNGAVFSGGSFIYVPPGVKVKHPLQAYFRINAENFGQFERPLIIADEGSEVMYMEGCTAPKFTTTTLHSAVV
jgi:Fe-S cluster assembly protein SufB